MLPQVDRKSPSYKSPRRLSVDWRIDVVILDLNQITDDSAFTKKAQPFLSSGIASYFSCLMRNINQD
jgi:hypothetical protein